MQYRRSDQWCIALRRHPSAVLRLLCFPYAGGRAAIFKSWCAELPPDVDVYGIELPGRGTRSSEPARTALRPLVADLAESLEPLLRTPFVFFGHSLGAILAFEVARWLRRTRGIVPEHLFVAGRRAPHLPDDEPTTYDKSEEEVIARLAELAGTPPEVLHDRGLLRAVLPTLRADFEIAETYRYVPDRPLACAITAFGGTDDRATLDERLPTWSYHTTGPFAAHLLEGDHFFLHSSEGALLELIRHELSAIIASSRVRMGPNGIGASALDTA